MFLAEYEKLLVGFIDTEKQRGFLKGKGTAPNIKDVTKYIRQRHYSSLFFVDSENAYSFVD